LCCFLFFLLLYAIFVLFYVFFVLLYAIFVLFYVFFVLFYVFFVLFYVFFVLFYVFLCFSMWCFFMTFPVLFVCICVLNNCHRVATQLQLNISYLIISYHIILLRLLHCKISVEKQVCKCRKSSEFEILCCRDIVIENYFCFGMIYCIAG
jgi:hypothetical protein